MTEDRIPYVGEGADGARRSAQIDWEEAATLPPREQREAAIASAVAWESQALRMEVAELVEAAEHVERWNAHERPGVDLAALPRFIRSASLAGMLRAAADCVRADDPGVGLLVESILEMARGINQLARGAQ